MVVEDNKVGGFWVQEWDWGMGSFWWQYSDQLLDVVNEVQQEGRWEKRLPERRMT